MSKKKLSEYAETSEPNISDTTTNDQDPAEGVERANNISIPKSVSAPEYIPTLPSSR